MRRLVVASAILAIAALAPLAASPAAALAPTDSLRATAALDYVLARQSANGSIDGSLGETADFIIGAADAGYDPSTLTGCGGGTGALDYLATASDAAASDAAATGKAILAVVAAGADPGDFHGRNLLARLAATFSSSTGGYGNGNTFAQSFAMLALVAAGQTVPAAAIAHLQAIQDPDGSWSYGDAPVPAGEGDSNSTAIALMALDQAGDHSRDASALAYLATQQMADGGFAYQNPSPWGPAVSDPDSDAVMVEALVAAVQDPEGSSWTKGSNSALTHLRSTQGADGGYAYPGMGANAFTTVQVPAALVRKPYAAAAIFTPGTSPPGSQCAGASPAPSADASASASASSSANASASPSPSPTKAPTARPTVRPTARVTAAPTVAPTPAESPSTGSGTPEPGVAGASPSPSPFTPIVVAGPTASPTSGPDDAAAGATAAGAGSGNASDASGDAGGPPAWLLYLLAALVAALVVVLGGWFVTSRPGKR